MTENERFRCLVDYLKENRYIRNQQQFVEDVKSDKTTISQLLNGRISAPKVLFGNVCAAYPFISMEQLRELWGAAVHPHEHDYLDMFKLMFLLCGISPVDLFHLPADAMHHGRIATRRSKTGQPIDIKLEPEAMELIGKHRGTNYLVDVLDRHKDYRNYLKRMGEALKSMGGVTYEYRKTRDGKHRVVAVRHITWPKLSPYWARHTWASIAYSIGVPIDVIGQAMGHSDRRVTEIYIAKDRSRVDEANRKVIDWVLYGRR
jgi:integrase